MVARYKLLHILYTPLLERKTLKILSRELHGNIEKQFIRSQVNGWKHRVRGRSKSGVEGGRERTDPREN